MTFDLEPALRHQLPEHIRQDAAMPEVVDLDRRVDPDDDGHVELLAALPRDGKRRLLPRLERLADAREIERLGPVTTRSKSSLPNSKTLSVYINAP